MKLYIYDHCPFCVKARMIFGLKNLPLELIVMLNDDEQTPKKLIGQKMAPILQQADGSAVPESMDIVRLVDKYATSISCCCRASPMPPSPNSLRRKRVATSARRSRPAWAISASCVNTRRA